MLFNGADLRQHSFLLSSPLLSLRLLDFNDCYEETAGVATIG